MKDKSMSAAERSVILEAQSLGREYRMGEVTVTALRESSVSILDGEFCVILGPSGSGKSTLLNILGGIDSPTSGAVLYEGRDISRLGKRDLNLYRRASVGFVFQFYNLLPSLTAWENVQMACVLAKEPLDASEILGQVGLAGRKDHFPSQMSGGEQQRVAIARALAKNPRILLCDEPTGALDSETGKQILSLLLRINETTGKTVLIITHNAAIGRLAHRVIRLRSGGVVSIEVNEKRLSPEEIEW